MRKTDQVILVYSTIDGKLGYGIVYLVMGPVAETGRAVVSETELAVPGFVERNGSASRRNLELLAVHEDAVRHNGEIDREANPDDWVDPVSSRKIFLNWMNAVDAVPLLERLEAAGQLDPDAAERRPDWVDEATVTETLRSLAEYMLGDESEVEAVHPRTRVRYQISPEELPARRLAIAAAEPEEDRVGDKTLISKRALVYDPRQQKFVSHVIYRRVGPGSLESRLDLGHQSDIKEREHAAKLHTLVQRIHELAESDIVAVDRREAA